MTADDQLDLGGLPLTRAERKRIATLWSSFAPFADTNFLNELRNPLRFKERYWEMCVAHALLRSGMELRKRVSDTGPDLLVVAGGCRIWIECVVPGPGESADAVPQPPEIALHETADGESLEDLLDADLWSRNGPPLVPEERIILRYRSALETKREAHERYLDSGAVRPNEAYVLAVNGAGVHPLFGSNAVVPTIAKAVFPLGHLQVTFSSDLAAPPATHLDKRESISKASGSPVKTDVFLDPAYAGISAVLFSHNDVTTGLRDSVKDMVLVRNPLAANRLRSGWLGRGQECWWEGSHLRMAPSKSLRIY